MPRSLLEIPVACWCGSREPSRWRAEWWRGRTWSESRSSPTISRLKSGRSWEQNSNVRTLLLVAQAFVPVLFSALLNAQSPKPKLPGEDWVPLFNGKDLSGWVNIGNEKWDVDGGTIHGQAMTKGYGYLRTEKNFKDFHLSLRFKCEGDGNSGVFFHVEFKPGRADVVQGPQFEIDCNIGQHSGGVYDVGRQWLVWPAPGDGRG